MSELQERIAIALAWRFEEHEKREEYEKLSPLEHWSVVTEGRKNEDGALLQEPDLVTAEQWRLRASNFLETQTDTSDPAHLIAKALAWFFDQEGELSPDEHWSLIEHDRSIGSHYEYKLRGQRRPGETDAQHKARLPKTREHWQAKVARFLEKGG